MSQSAITDLPAPQRHTEPNLGAVFTKRWVADLILDLAGYTPDRDLARSAAIEPSVGHGAFMVPMALRVLESARRHGVDLAEATGALIGYDVHRAAVRATRTAVAHALTSEGVAPELATRMSRAWIRHGDFLTSVSGCPRADWVIGNPPYVRVEDVDRDQMAAYRAAWPTMSGRADLYVGFLEAGMTLLAPDGRLAVICADRWMRNQYGAGLRRKVEAEFAVDACVVMHDVHAFENKVAAYPAITMIRNGEQGPALVCDADQSFDAAAARRLVHAWSRGPAPVATDLAYRMSWTTGWFTGHTSWPDADPSRLGVLTELEARLPLLEDTGARVYVGVATGADDIYITDRAANTEPDRLLKTISAKETSSGRIEWAGRYLVNPWTEDGLTPLDQCPGMAAYLRRHAARLKARHVAGKNPRTWWRTIDRIDPAIASTPKLLIPDLKDRIAPVLDPGEYYPGHSLYYITSDTWDLEVLGGLLLSDLATMFVEAYSVRMANGYLRVSAQYLRRVRVPQPDELPADVRVGLRAAFRTRDLTAANDLARAAYGIG